MNLQIAWFLREKVTHVVKQNLSNIIRFDEFSKVLAKQATQLKVNEKCLCWLPPARKRTMLHKFITKFFFVFVFVFIIQSFGFQYTCNVQRLCIWRQLSTLEPVKAYCSSKFWYIYCIEL